VRRIATSEQSWFNFIKELLREADRSDIPDAAAALAFYAMLALFPAAIFGLSLLPYLPIPHLKEAIFGLLRQLLPGSAAQLFTSTVDSLVSRRSGGLVSLGLGFALLTASSGVYALMKQLSRMYGVREERSYLRARGVALVLTFVLFVLMVATLGLVIFGGVLQEWLGDQFGWSSALRLLFACLRWLLIISALLSAFALVARLAANRRAPFRVFTVGSVLATLGFLIACLGFRSYVERFANYDAMYGSLGAVIVLLLWLWGAGFVVLLGAKVDSMRAARHRAVGHGPQPG
jgi:membrane protein